MKSKRLLSILITVFFLVACVVTGAFAFTVKKVNANLSLIHKDGLTVQASLDKFVGNNLLFFKPESLVAEIEKDAYLDVVEVKKEYPNIINVKVVERKETYLIEFNSKTYILDDTGFVLSELTDEKRNSPEFDERNFVLLTANDIDGFENKFAIIELKVGELIKTSNDDTFSAMLDMIDNAGHATYIKTANILINDNASYKNAYFTTYTGVIIEIINVEKNALTKTQLALELYVKNDYYKSEHRIQAYDDESINQVVVLWTDNY